MQDRCSTGEKSAREQKAHHTRNSGIRFRISDRASLHQAAPTHAITNPCLRMMPHASAAQSLVKAWV